MKFIANLDLELKSTHFYFEQNVHCDAWVLYYRFLQYSSIWAMYAFTRKAQTTVDLKLCLVKLLTNRLFCLILPKKLIKMLICFCFLHKSLLYKLLSFGVTVRFMDKDFIFYPSKPKYFYSK